MTRDEMINAVDGLISDPENMIVNLAKLKTELMEDYTEKDTFQTVIEGHQTTINSLESKLQETQKSSMELFNMLGGIPKMLKDAKPENLPKENDEEVQEAPKVMDMDEFKELVLGKDDE